ncbi:helix-turn-helix transcriptional regulator [Allonocardiopsis opalescens]|uniref:Putative DNA-binding transcriptional regulator YafY n=1 Tax=Allonocardiopsis opalescens TaxID=1144618 RepID=A0A2T0Q4M4_9ACTN|nr:YafY family protein [Allonocardiopsis opalescens]PRX98754.1 putative DNA-binding transcriptional regulator YafY [Allonocardiopsis opalescens]
MCAASHPTARVLTLLELLQATPGLGGAELARRLGVDERTVRRYAALLVELGIPVQAARGRIGGYRLTPGYRLPPLMLAGDEAVAVVLGLIAADRIGLAPAEAGAGALAKVSRVLPRELADQVAAVRDTLGLTLPAQAARSPRAAVVLVIGQAVRDRRRLDLEYRDRRGEPSRREVDPYGLVFHGGRWYLTGHDHSRGALRTFRLDRVAHAAALAAGFEVPAGFDPVARVAEALARAPYTWRVRIRLEAPLEAARERIPATVGTLSPDGGGVLWESRVERLDEMARWVASLGWPFRVLEPEELREEIGRLARWLAEQAADGGGAGGGRKGADGAGGGGR